MLKYNHTKVSYSMVGNQWNWGSLPFNDSIICLGHENLYGEFNVLFLSFLWLGKVNLRISQQGLSYTICIQWNLSNTPSGPENLS